MLAVLAFYDAAVNQRGILLLPDGKAKGCNAEHFSVCMAEQVQICAAQNDMMAGHFVDVEGIEEIGSRSGKLDFFVERVDLPSREQVYDAQDKFTPKAAALWEIFERNEAARRALKLVQKSTSSKFAASR